MMVTLFFPLLVGKPVASQWQNTAGQAVHTIASSVNKTRRLIQQTESRLHASPQSVCALLA